MYSHDGPNGLGLSIGIGPIDVGIPLPGGGGGFVRDPNLLCPGTPPDIIRLVGAAFRRDPALAATYESRMASVFRGEKDLRVAQASSSSPEGLAQAVVWLAWGGADCKTGSKEPPLQADLRRIAAAQRTREAEAVRARQSGAGEGAGAPAPTTTSTAVGTVVGLGVIGAILAGALKKR